MVKRRQPWIRWIARQRAQLKGRLTPAGWVVVGGLGFTSVIGLDTESSLSYQAFAVLACLLLLSFLGVLVFRGRFALQRTLPRFGSVNEPFRYRVRVSNLTASPQDGLTLLEHLGELEAELSESLRRFTPQKGGRSFKLAQGRARRQLAFSRESVVPPLPPKSQAELTAEIIPLRRGPLRFTASRIARTDPFGLLRAFASVEQPQSVLILPKRYPIPRLDFPGSEQYQIGGVTQASSVGQSEEFVSLRDYRRGDPLRHIHWRSWAKAGKPIVKEFQDEYFVRHGLVLDTFDDPESEEAFEEAVSVAASFACTLGTQDSLLDLMFVGTKAYRFTAGRGVAHTDQLMEILAGAELTQGRAFAELATLVTQHAGSLTSCLLILLRWDEDRRNLVKDLREIGVPLRIILVQAAESKANPVKSDSEAPPTGTLVLTAGRIAEGLATWG